MSRVRNFVEPFALSYPFAPEMVKLVPAMANVHGGVSIAKANEPEGFLFLMLAYLGQARNDKLILFVNDVQGPSTTIAEGKENDDTPLRLAAGLLQKGLNRVRIYIERTSGNNESTPELVLYHRTSPPGDLPPVLNLDVSHKFIGAAEADKFKVTVTYDNPQWYDRIFVFCNGAHFEYPLTPSSDGPLPPVPKSVVIDIPKDKLIEGGNDKTFEIKYRVIDYVTNPSGPPTWSDAVFVVVDLSVTRPPLAIDQSLMSLDGIKLMQDYGWATKEVVGNVEVREASGGVPPYRYASSDDAIASVTSNGKVEGLKNGTATLSVTDDTGTTLRYSVLVSNLYKIQVDNRPLLISEAMNWIRSVGGEVLTDRSLHPGLAALPLNFANLSEVFPITPMSPPGIANRWFGQVPGQGLYMAYTKTTQTFSWGSTTDGNWRTYTMAIIKTW